MKSIYFFVLTLIFLMPNFSGEAQNLVLNPGFETLNPSKKAYKSCHFTKHPESFNARLAKWGTFSGITPDLIIRPDDIEDCIYPAPHSGKNMVGMILYHPKEDTGYEHDYHEVIQGRLKTSLVAGTTYNISLWVYFDTKIGIDHLGAVYGRKTSIYPVASNNLGFLFTTSPFGSNEYIHQSIEQFDLKPQAVFEDIILTPKGKWQKLSITFLAKRNYKYFLMGNFSSDFRTNIKPDDFEDKFLQENKKTGDFYSTAKRIAYYCFDDIDIRPYNEINIEEALAEDKVYTFKNLNFDSGKAILKDEALNELDVLAKWLVDNNDKNVEIGGHTDDIGQAKSNQILSQKRAVAVYGYLLTQGIEEARLSFKGYGESLPKTTNKTTVGRKINRRVECKLID